MVRRFSANFAVLSIFLDSMLVVVCLGAAALLRIWFNRLPGVQSIDSPIFLPVSLYVLFPVIWVGALLLFSVYDGRQNLRWVDEFSTLAAGSILAVISMAGVLYLSYRDVSRFLFLSFAGLSFGTMFLWRLAARLANHSRRMQTSRQRRVLILGAGTVGRELEKQIRGAGGLGLMLSGFLDDDPGKRAACGDIFGPLEDARQVVQQQGVDDVVVALPLSAYARFNRIVSGLHDLPVRVWVIPDYFSLSLHRASVEEFAGMPMLDLRAPALGEYQRMIKRAFDLVVTFSAMPFVLPVMAAAAAAIKLDSPGPVFFKQKRAGENGRVFSMIKFRTMVQNAEALQAQVTTVDEQGRPIHKHASDPRITRVGRFLRRTSLDELPQLFNVIRGEMSLVGPRPEMPYLVEKYQNWQRTRFAVPQGMTGWWQINGRSDRPMHLNTEQDLYYVQHYSIWLDLSILLKTVWVVVRGKGAY